MVEAVTGRNAKMFGGSEVDRGYRDVQARIQMLESHLDSTFIPRRPYPAFERGPTVAFDEDSVTGVAEPTI